MPNIWFTADTHFGHTNILQYEPLTRPFSSIEEHDEVLIQNWNAVVKPNDIVWHLGDVTFGQKGLKSVAALNGIKKLVLGNHDHLATKTYLQFFNKVYGALGFNGNTVLSHVPVHPSQMKFRWILNIHGHLHSSKLEDPVYFDVGLDKRDLTPVSWDLVQDYLAQLTASKNHKKDGGADRDH